MWSLTLHLLPLLLHDVVRENLIVYIYYVVGNGDGFPLRQRVDAGLSLSPYVCL
jgi:hypothetical protein